MFDPVLPDAMLLRDCLLEQGWSPVLRIPSKLSLILFYLMLYSLGIVYWNKDGVQFLGIPSNYQD